MMNDDEYIKRAKSEIVVWESAGPGYLAQVGDFVLWPVQQAVDVLAPDAVQEAVGKAVEAFLNGLTVASRSLIDVEGRFGRF